MAEEKPIFDFTSLKRYLNSIGIQVGEAVNTYRAVKPGDVTINGIKGGQYTFRDDGIYINLPNGERQQIFLYKGKYHLKNYGKPRMHIRKCSTIQEFIDSGSFRKEYRHANTESVPVVDMDNDDNEVIIDGLPLCRNCAAQLINEEKGIVIDSNSFVALLKATRNANDEEENIDVDIFGYTKGWEKISKDYRSQHNYTCEKCGLHITNKWDYRFMHVHHIDGDKTNNEPSNLQCLCVRCHSQVDETHKMNFSVGANKIILDEFNSKYPPAENRESLPPKKEIDDYLSDDDLPF